MPATVLASQLLQVCFTLGLPSYRRIDVHAHRLLGYTVLLVAVAHVLWFLLGDAVSIEYIKFGAPDYMWFGIVGLILLFILVMISRLPDRSRLHRDYPMFVYWHRILAVAVVASSTYHIVVSNFYLATWYQTTLFIAITAVATFARAWWIKFGPFPVVTPSVLIIATVLFIGIFCVIRNLPL